MNATSSGVSGAELCILCDDITVPADSYVEAAGYFGGTFKGSSIIIPYEGDEDDHADLIEGLRAKLRSQGIYIV